MSNLGMGYRRVSLAKNTPPRHGLAVADEILVRRKRVAPPAAGTLRGLA
ncbi:hypothetical protein [Rathayibacter toxicus]|nr:hypothetical protein [Rathayibacter toxicus]QOD09721.1 hypothetical protein BSG36_07090 [Rathayibacter toxicus]